VYRNASNLSRVADELVPVSAELAAGVGVRLPAREVLGEDGAPVVEVRQQSADGRLQQIHARLELAGVTRALRIQYDAIRDAV